MAERVVELPTGGFVTIRSASAMIGRGYHAVRKWIYRHPDLFLVAYYRPAVLRCGRMRLLSAEDLAVLRRAFSVQVLSSKKSLCTPDIETQTLRRGTDRKRGNKKKRDNLRSHKWRVSA